MSLASLSIVAAVMMTLAASSQDDTTLMLLANEFVELVLVSSHTVPDREKTAAFSRTDMTTRSQVWRNIQMTLAAKGDEPERKKLLQDV
jgi:hypothetical protein